MKLLEEKDVEIQRLRSELHSLQGVQHSPLLSHQRSLDRSASYGTVSGSVHETSSASLPAQATTNSGSDTITGTHVVHIHVHMKEL